MTRIIKTTIIILFIFFVSIPFVHAESNLKINEFVAHPSGNSKEWIEFYNPDKIDLSSYYVDDDTSFTEDVGSSAKKSLANLAEGASNHPYLELSSFLNNSGDYVVLFDSSGNLIDQYHYDKDPGSDIAIGRSPDGTGEFQVLANATKGEANSGPVPTPTPSPLPTSTPTTEPTPTKIPTPTKTPTPTPTLKVPTPTRTPTPVKSSSTSSPTNTPIPVLKFDSKSTSANKTTEQTMQITDRLMPSPILGISTKSASKASLPLKTKSKPKTLVKASTDNKLPLLIGSVLISVLLISGGIIYALKIKRQNHI